MKRRAFITLLGGAAAAWPLAPRAQQQAPVRPLIGLLSPLSAAAAARNVAAFRSGLRDLGYLEGHNATLELRYGEGVAERMAPLAQELVVLKADVPFAGAKSGAFAARAATQTIPIVIITADDPVALGLARTIAKPGGNVTGTWFDYHALVSKRLEFLRLALPAVARVGAIVNPDDPTDSLTISLLPAAARALGMTVEQFDVRDVTKLDAVAAAIARADVGALVVGDGPTLVSARAEITANGGSPAIAGHVRLPRVRGGRRPDVLWIQPSRRVSAVGQAGCQDSQGRPPWRSPIRTAGPLRIDCQSQDRQSDWAHDLGLVCAPRRRGDRMTANMKRREFNS